MHFDLWTFALQTINFAILVWILHRFLYRPVLRLIDARRKEVDKQFADAKGVEEKAQAKLAETELERSKINAEREQAIQSATQQASEMMRARKEQAEKEAAAMLDDARATLAHEREQALVEARETAFDLGADIARRLVESIPADKRAEAWIERVEQYLAQMPEADRSALAAQVSGDASLTVVTPAALTREASQVWTDRLRRSLGDGATVQFSVDPKLIAGAELHFPEAILRFSFQSTLTALRADVDGHGKTCR